MDNNWGEDLMKFHHDGHLHHHQGVIDALQECEEMCEHMTTHLKGRYDVNNRRVQLQLLRDCADICTLTAKFIARNSVFSKGLANSCAYICEVCGRECARFPDRESQECAQICFHCSRECRAFATMM